MPLEPQSDWQRGPLVRYLRWVLIGMLVLMTVYPVGRYIWREYRWRWIIVHHTGSDNGNLDWIIREHQAKGWKDAAYHFVVNNGSRDTVAGQIEISQRWQDRENAGSTQRSYVNEFGIAIVMIGNLQNHPPPLLQREALLSLLVRLASKYDIPPERIRGHNELQNTKCPGKHLDMQQVRREVAAKLASMEK
ncbi:MAG: N-acetylmuramoyl-L-alanine amidase [Leptospiraceae bacterium]|nr:N-acetylmuramoyl-L-alanine amidase [Leptospiraceae bacterium]